MTERNVLLENEIKANFILAKILLLIFFIVILTVILTLTGFFGQPKFDYWLNSETRRRNMESNQE